MSLTAALGPSSPEAIPAAHRDAVPSEVRVRALQAVLPVLVALVTTAPGLLGQSSQLRRLARDIEDALSTYRWPSATWAVFITSLDQGDTLFAVNADSTLAPASNVKLLTSAAALSSMGPEFRFRTYLVSSGQVTDGVLDGDLVLYGTGDPGISDRFFSDKHAVFHLLIDQLAEQGIHTVRGDLVGDASFLPGPLRPESWDPADLDDHFAAAVSALSFNENVVSFRVEAASTAGGPPNINTIPDHAGLDIANNAITVSNTSRQGLAILRDDPLAPIRVEGSIRRNNRDLWRQMTVPDPPTFALSVFRAVLEERGIRVTGRNRVEVRPEASTVSGPSITAPLDAERPRTRTLARHSSPPLREYLEEVNKHSNNLYAELLFRTMGRISGGSGSPPSAVAAVTESLAGLGVEIGGTVLVDGSGLSASNRISPATFVSLLSHVAESPLWTDFWYTLPTAGTRRELGRMYRTAAAGNLRAKTGTIEDVSALSGVVRSQDSERLAFSILVNGTPSTTRAKRVENEIGVRLASFSRGADAPGTVVPDPETPVSTTERYRVQRGESFTTIARRHRVTLDELLQANPQIEPRRLQAGQWILIPPASQSPAGS